MQEILSIINQIQISGNIVQENQPLKLNIDKIYQSVDSFNAKKICFANSLYVSQPQKIQKTGKAILIRKHDLNMFMSLNNSTKPRPLVKML